MKTKPKTKKSKWPKLPVAFKRKWVKALRSGEYKQGEGGLFNGEGFCCLGVAGKICGVREDRMKGRILFSNESPTHYTRPPGALPECLVGPDRTGTLLNALTKKNDDGWSFRRIATWIEKNL